MKTKFNCKCHVKDDVSNSSIFMYVKNASCHIRELNPHFFKGKSHPSPTHDNS